MNEKYYLKYRELIFDFINNEIIPKYDILESCNMHILPKNLVTHDVEFIIKVKNQVSKNELSFLKSDVEKDLDYYCVKLGDPTYFLRILLIFTEI